MTIKVMSINDVVVFQTKGDHFTGMNIREAHAHVTEVLQAIESAQGFEDAMAGKVRDYIGCPNCKARNITTSHKCRTRSVRTGK